MDDSFPELEAELKSLPLRQPSPRLAERLAAELSAGAGPAVPEPPRYTTSTNLSSWKWSVWRTAGLAAALAVFAAVGLLSFRHLPAPAAGIRSPQVAATAPVPDKTSDRYQPVAATNVLYDLKDEGLVRADDDTAAHRIRYRYLDTYTWKNPKGNASLKWSVPRDEIRLVSATLN